MEFDAGRKHLFEVPQTKQALRQAASYFKKIGVQFIVLESTATYHMLAYEVMRELKLNVHIINPLQVKALLKVEGKSDRADAENLALLAATFPLRTSNMPDIQQKEVRDNLRQLDKNQRALAALRQSVQTRLYGMGIPIYKHVGLKTVSGRSILQRLAYSRDDAQSIATDEWKGRRSRLPTLRAALEGCDNLPDWFRTELAVACHEMQALEDRIVWRQQLASTHIQRFELADQVAWMSTAPGVNQNVALRIVGEMGQDFWLRYSSPEAFSKALGLAPNNLVSAGKVLKTGKALGNRHVKQALLMQMRAWLLNTKDHPLKAWQMKYKRKSGFKKSVSACANHTAKSLWHMGNRGGLAYIHPSAARAHR